MDHSKAFLHSICGMGKSELINVYAQRHNRFLLSLREDTLLIVDNFNVTREQDDFLDVMLKYRCRILFTTRSRYENQISLEVRELPMDTLLVQMGIFYEAGRKTGMKNSWKLLRSLSITTTTSGDSTS